MLEAKTKAPSHHPDQAQSKDLLPEKKLIDRLGRHISYIRLSVTDRCDFRCTYCMAENMQFLPRNQVLTLEEALVIIHTFANLGVHKVRITGGEPLVRRNILWLLKEVAELPGIRELTLTTNGSQLEHYASDLKSAGVKRLNISLDTLDSERFHAITRIGNIDKVLRGIAAARQAGFKRTKINSVLSRENHQEESLRLVRFAIENELNITFIEAMPLGNIGNRQSQFVSNNELLAHLGKHFALYETDETTGGPAQYWKMADNDIRIGLISPHSHNFCSDCNRVRITAKGELYPCLGQNDAIALLPIIRSNSTNTEKIAALTDTIQKAMIIKAPSHNFSEQMDNPQIIRFMSMTGG